MKTFSLFRSPAAFAAVLAISGAIAPRAHADTLYGLTFFDNELIAIDSNTGAGTLIASLGESVSGYGLAMHGSNLYTFDPNLDQLRQIDAATGAITNSTDIGVGDLTGEGDLAFRADGAGFLSSALTPDFEPANQLFRFDATLGTSVLIGATAVPLDGMVFVGNTLYAIGQEADAMLYTVDTETATLTLVGALGVAKNSPFGALTVDAQGRIYGAIDDRLFSIDPATGAAMVVNEDVLDIGFASVSGLAAATFTPIPEPSTYAAAGAAILLGLCLRRRMQSRSKLV